ncbi:MAG: OmpA family protein [Rhodobacterales bacterium]|nr:OmpA family protein [Rhodobacterales bacterium]
MARMIPGRPRRAALPKTLLAIVLAALAAGALTAAGPAWAEDVDCETEPGSGQLDKTVVLFDVDSTKIKPEDVERLKRLADWARFKTKICVVGQADKQGSEDYNKKLALRRAQAVSKVLVANGVKAKTIHNSSRGEAFGDSFLESLRPAGWDRRVEVLVPQK